MPHRQSFETTWPPVARRLQAALRHRRVPRAMTEDLVQETGLRLFQIWNRVDPNRDIWPLALTIALNVLRDHIRAQSRRTQIAIPDAQLDHDTEAIALARVELEQVHAALEQLTDGQRSALLAEIGAAEQPDESASSLKMLRLRGRKRLRALIDRASAAVASFELALQRLWRSAPASPLSEQLVPCVSVAAGLLCAASFGGIGTAAGDHAAVNTHKGSFSSHGGAPNAINWLDQSMSLAMATGSSAWIDDMARAIGGLEAAEGDAGPGGGELGERRVVVNPQGPDRRHRRPRTGPRPDGVRVHNPRAKVSPDGYRVSGGGTADVGGQRLEVTGAVESGNNDGSG
ncbi:MAG: sigma-70 family RNA polymerase sigma factor, partial [Actinomycetota bacterium]|nr:sigma-70 family RNA polymerase sigma factor [Actinomycetota bacterium]